MQIFVRLDLLLSDEKWIKKKKIKQISLCVERIVCERIEIMWRSHVAVELKLALRKKKRAAAAVDTNDSNFVARMEWAPRSDCTTNSKKKKRKKLHCVELSSIWKGIPVSVSSDTDCILGSFHVWWMRANISELNWLMDSNPI